MPIHAVRTRGIASFLIAFFVTAAPGAISNAGAQSLPTNWKKTDIGAAPSPGSATFAAPTFTVTSRGFDVNGTADRFTFANTSIRNDATIVARITAVPNVDPWAQAGLMIREGNGAGLRHAFVFLTPRNGVAVRTRPQRDGTTSQTSGGAATAPVWLKLERRGTTLTASRSSNGTSWTLIRTMSVSLPETALVGLAVASHSATSSLSATFDNVRINGQTYTTVNAPPTISLTSPTNGYAYTSPASVAMSATARDTDGVISSVRFYAGTTLLATDRASPFAFTWTGMAAGSYAVKAIATDNRGASTTSATATVTVAGAGSSSGAGNTAPNVSLTSPANGATFLAPATVTFSANAADANGTIQKVQFYVGSQLVGTDTTSPYSMTWLAAAGSYSVGAVATDNQGAVTVSAWRDFVVTATPLLSNAIFNPALPADAVDYYVFEIFRAGVNPSTGVPIATQNLGLPPIVSGEVSADVRATILALAAGNYVATVVAVGDAGPLRSNAFSFTR